MIITILGVPQLTLLELRIICEEIGIRMAHFSDSYAPKKMKIFSPTYERYLGPMKVVLIESVSLLNKYAPILSRKPEHHTILVNEGLSILKQYEDIPIHKDGYEPYTKYDMIRNFYLSPKREEVFFKEKIDFEKSIISFYSRESMLHTLQPAFYRIRDMEERNRAQNFVYSYLGGMVKKVHLTGIRKIDNLISSPEAVVFRQAVELAKKTGVDKAANEFKLDRFEIAFVMKRCGLDVR
jgi:hypothetical protein